MDLVSKIADAGSMLWTTLGYGERLVMLYIVFAGVMWLLSMLARSRKHQVEERERRMARLVAAELAATRAA